MDPTWFLHIADIHLSSIRPNSFPYILQCLNSALSLYRPHRILIAGDLTDDWGGEKVRPYNRQISTDWTAYKQLLALTNLTSDDRVIHTVGNHDLFDVRSYDSPTNFAKAYFPNETSFRMRVSHYDDQGVRYKFVALNEYSFPTGPICFLQWTFMTDEFRQRITAELSRGDSDVSILLTHYPALRYHPRNEFARILKGARNLRFVMSGHWHPRGSPFFLHFGDAFEVVGMALFRDPVVGLVTFDNHRAAYHVVNLSARQCAVMTSPVSARQGSGHDAFHESATEVRALVFCGQGIDLRVRGAVEGQLRFRRQISDTVWVYSLPLSLPPGRHVLYKEGDWSGEVHFVIGETIGRFWEIPYIMQPSTAWTVVFLLAYLPALLLVLPGSAGRRRDGGALEEVLGLRMRFLGLPKRLYGSLCIATIACVLVPVSLMPVEGTVGFFFVFGNVFGNGFHWHYIGAQYGLCYLFCVFYPIVVVADAWVTGKGKLFAVAVFVVAFRYYVYMYCWLFDMFGIVYALTSPMMTFVPVWLFGNLIYFVVELREFRVVGDQAGLLPARLYNG